MGLGKKKGAIPAIEEPTDPLSWIVDNEFANFVLMNTNEIVSGNQSRRAAIDGLEEWMHA